MPGHDVEITVSPDDPHRASVKVDGVERHNAVSAYMIHHEVGERPTIVVLHPGVLEVPPPGCDFEGMTWRERAEVYITAESVELLTALGWTPPPNQGVDLEAAIPKRRGPHG